jgi:Etoposide-induced protein 2.4 (EI24)
LLTRLPLRSVSAPIVDAFWRAAAYCLHPRVIVASLLPLAIVGGIAAALGYFFWESAVASVRATLDDWALLDAVFAWLRSIGGAGWASVVAPLIIVALALPVFVVASLLVAALAMTPAIVRLVAKRRFPTLERRHGGSFWSGLAASALSTLVAVVALVVSIPFWLVPPLVLVLPPLIWGWLTYRVLAFDVLAAHASRDERVQLIGSRRWALLGMGIVCGLLGAAPSLLWAMSALTLVFAPFLILVSIWLYTLVFAFSSLWFAHYLLSALQRLRSDDSAVATTAPAPGGTVSGASSSDPAAASWRSSLA